MQKTLRNKLSGWLGTIARHCQACGSVATFTVGVMILPVGFGSPDSGASPWGSTPVMAQGNIDISNGNGISLGQGQGRSNGKHARNAQRAVPVIGQATGVDGVSRGFKLARREYEKQIRRIRFKYFAGNKKKHPPNLERGFAELAAITDTTAIEPMIEILRGEGADVREWLLDHLQYAVEDPYGQATLTWLSIYDNEKEMREAARARLMGFANQRSQYVIDQALRLADHDLVNGAAFAAGKFRLIQAIPLLIATQTQPAANSRVGTGALAFVQFQKQSYFVSDLQPVVGTNSVGFDPQLSVLQEGSVMVIEDAVVEFVRPQVHRTLLDLVRGDFGQPVDFGYDRAQWRAWYHDEYLPFKQAQVDERAVAEATAQDG